MRNYKTSLYEARKAISTPRGVKYLSGAVLSKTMDSSLNAKLFTMSKSIGIQSEYLRKERAVKGSR